MENNNSTTAMQINIGDDKKKFNWDSLIGKTMKIWTSAVGLHYCIGTVTNYQMGYLQLRNVMLQHTRKERDSVPVDRIQKIEEIV